MSKRARGLEQLGTLRDALKRQAEQREATHARRRLESLRRDRYRDQDAFRDAVADAVPLAASGRREPERTPVAPQAQQFERDERLALAESISDHIDVDRMLDTDAALSYRRPGVPSDVVRKLRRGHWVIQRQLDLHGLRVDEARTAVLEFLAECLRREIRCVRIIHGKGLRSANREPVLKSKVQRWLVQRDEVLAFCQAGPFDGGSGAVLALLR